MRKRTMEMTHPFFQSIMEYTSDTNNYKKKMKNKNEEGAAWRMKMEKDENKNRQIRGKERENKRGGKFLKCRIFVKNKLRGMFVYSKPEKEGNYVCTQGFRWSTGWWRL